MTGDFLCRILFILESRRSSPRLSVNKKLHHHNKTHTIIFSTYFFWLDNLEERSPLFQAELVNSEAVAETAETHQRSDVHLEKEKEFQSFRNLYVAEIYPYLMQLGDDLFAERKQMEDVTLDFERLERCRDSLLSEVEKIESTRRWTATALLLEAVKEFKAELEKTEQGMQANKSILTTDDIH